MRRDYDFGFKKSQVKGAELESGLESRTIKLHKISTPVRRYRISSAGNSGCGSDVCSPIILAFDPSAGT